MATGWLMVALVFRDITASAIAGACMLAVAAYIVTRPSYPKPAPEPKEPATPAPQ
jgi:hypothetical protein